MRELFAKNQLPQRVVGYSEIWYSAQQEQHTGIMVPKEIIWQAEAQTRFEGITFGPRDSANFRWKSFVGPYHTDGYLLGSSIVVVNELSKRTELGLRCFPEYVISIISQTKEGLQEIAKRLRLPLEELVLDQPDSKPTR